MVMKGIDVSSHQGAIDWTSVKASGIQFAIVRAGYGNDISQKDTCFEQNIKGAQSVGIKCGAYWFSYAISEDDARKEAKVFQQVLKGHKLEFPVFYDFEYDSVRYAKDHGVGITQAKATAFAKAFMDEMTKGGFLAGNYSNLDYIRNYFDDTQLTEYPLWLAVWGNGKPDSRMGIWQYADNGKVSGISGNTDMNFAYVDYEKIIKEKGLNGYKKGTTTLKPEKEEPEVGVKRYSYSKDKNKKLGEHFVAGEFACFNGSGILQADEFLHNSELVPVLEKLFVKLNCKTIVVTSGYRTPAFSVSIGGFANDQHTLGNAADIVCNDKNGKAIDAKKVCCTLEDMGHKGGVGYICSTATHVDVRGYKAYFDEERDGGATAFDSFYSHWGIKKPSSTTNNKSNTSNGTTSKTNVDVTYMVETQKHGWLPAVKNTSDYAGYEDSPITKIAIKVSKGAVKYRVHIKGGSWLPYVTGYDKKDSKNGYAGNGKPIDALEIYYSTPSDIRPYKKAKYRVSPINGNYYNWQYDNEKTNGQDGYAGAIGQLIGKVQIAII